MKRFLLSAIAGLAFSAYAGAANAQATYTYQVDVPFRFEANGRVLPAGPVTIECASGRVTILNEQHKPMAVIPSRGILLTSSLSSLYFKTSGNLRKLAGVRDPLSGRVIAL